MKREIGDDQGDDDDDDNVVFFKVVKKAPSSSSSAPPPPSPSSVKPIAPIPVARISRTVQAGRKPSSSSITVKRERESEEEEDDDGFVAPLPVPSNKRHAVEYTGEDISSPVLSVLGTFDKGHKGRQSEEQRVELSRQRIRQSTKTIPRVNTSDDTAVIDDSLLTDPVQHMARQYEAQIQLQFDGDREQEQEEEQEIVFTEPVHEEQSRNPETRRTEEFYASAKALVLPNMRAPESGSKFVVNTFPEYLDRSDPRRTNLERSLSMQKLQNQSSAVRVHNPGLAYKDARGTLDKRLGLLQFRKYAVRNNLLIPELPEVTKEDNRDGLWEADTEIGERPCIFGEKCMSWVMCEERIADDPETYAHMTPFVCKEFYFGERAEQIRSAKAKGIPLSEVQGPNQTMCLLCHLANGRNWYTDYDLELAKVPVHVIHAFQYQVGIPGQYPLDMMLMGDNKFKGVIAPFLRFCRDNYIWRPARPNAAAARGPGQANKKVRQHWDEAACLDF